jgi:hypothetical protein
MLERSIVEEDKAKEVDNTEDEDQAMEKVYSDKHSATSFLPSDISGNFKF